MMWVPGPESQPWGLLPGSQPDSQWLPPACLLPSLFPVKGTYSPCSSRFSHLGARHSPPGGVRAQTCTPMHTRG